MFRSLPLLLLLAFSAGAHAEVPSPVTPVAGVDLARYAGRWFEIAAFPMFFQRNCLGDTTAEYTLRPDGEVTVDNRCRTESGTDRAIGRAWAVADSGNARLKVSFFWPFRSDYWIIGLDEEYRWAVVGHPDRKYLWILSRTPQLPEAEASRALAAASAQGYDLTRLVYTRQSPPPAQ